MLPSPTIQDLGLQELETAAQDENALAFLSAQKQIDWSKQPPEHFVQAVRWALTAGAHLSACQLATLGAKQYPTHAELKKMAYILAPPKVTVSKHLPDPGIRANQEWLKSNWHQYHGRWIALRRGELLAAADAIEDVLANVGETKNTGILVTKVY